MAFAGHDQPCLDAGLCLGGTDAGRNARHIGIGAETDAVAMVGRDDELAIDRADAGKLLKVGFGQQRIVFLSTVNLGNLIVADEEFGKILPEVDAILEESAGVDAVFLCLSQRQSWRGGTLQMAVQLHFLQMRCQRKLLPCGPAAIPKCLATVSPISA